uniref:Sucrose-6-phosphate hydrolase n=1 Tax=Sphenophorus levis TaxID=572107 RepID=A0A088DJ59_9CUCU|nr:beta-fructofuranosidase [Sphenophorus levis]
MNKIPILICLLIPIHCIGENISWYPKFHLAPPKGWMNDPNGLSFFDGYYHAFYQHYPDKPEWGLMHWGHARSINMLDWEHLPIALSPSIPEDIDGIFSGSAVVNDGNLTLMYTGVSGNSTHQAQCIAYGSDGINFKKVGVVLKKDGNDLNFRDPKLWKQDDSWFVVVGSKTYNNRGEVLLYSSPDLYSWDYQGVLAQADKNLGYMWECPDFFTLNGKQILIINPQGISAKGYDYLNLYQTGYFVGAWEPGKEYQIEKGFREIDHGHDFYASQTFLAPDGRRILIAWLDMWESEFPEQSEAWAGMFTLPRELTLSECGDLQIRPIREVQDKRRAIPINHSPLFVDNKFIYITLKDAPGHEVYLEFDKHHKNATVYGAKMGDADHGFNVYVDVRAGRLFLERSYVNFNISKSSRNLKIDLKQPISLDIFVDSSSVEVFVNNGFGVLSSRIYPTDKDRELVVYSDSKLLKLNTYKIWRICE